MGSGTISFLFGTALLQRLACLPEPELWAPALSVFALLWLARRRFRGGDRYQAVIRVAFFITAGFMWAVWRASWLLADALPREQEGRDLVVDGTVVGLPEHGGERTRFDFRPDHVTDQGKAVSFHGRMRLTWYEGAPEMHAGERWHLTVRLKRPNGMANPGGFDYEGWLFQHRISATGYVRKEETNRRTAANHGHSVDGIRDILRGRMLKAIGQEPTAGILIALAIGDGSLVRREEWDLFRITGTTHLMAISGLHVGMVALLVAFLVRRLWRSPRLIHVMPAQKAATLGGLVVAAVYALLAGFSVPTQRTLVMLAAVAFALLASRSYRPATMLGIACWAVLLFDPLAVMAPGFWLSFGAVALILYGMHGRLQMGGLWWRWGRLQWLMTVGLTPVLFLFFGSASVASPLANLAAVPWLSFVVVPLTLAGMVLLGPFPQLGTWLMQTAALAMEGLLPVLRALADHLPAWVLPGPPLPVYGTAIIGVVLSLAPRGWPARALGLIWCLPLLCWDPPRPAEGEVWLTLLDVGQGLAAVVETRSHVLVYDTGPSFGEDFDTGQAVIGPFLRREGWSRLDLLVVSHGDNDHIGGARSLTRALPVDRVLTGVPQRMPWVKAEPCLRGEHWRWEGISFDVLHPEQGSLDNSGSCVMQVTGPGGALLLTGDIEAPAEHALTEAGRNLHARVLVVPHHGSKTSSTEPFVAAVSPEFALFAVGYRNRYHFPNAGVILRYRAHGVRLLDTASSGAITVRLHPDGALETDSWRVTARRYWQRE